MHLDSSFSHKALCIQEKLVADHQFFELLRPFLCCSCRLFLSEHFSPLSSLGFGGACIRKAIPLLVSAALFGLVHTEFVQDAPPSADGDAGAAPDVLANASEQQIQETKAYWFRATALYGALYSLLYVISGHRLLAPLFCHAGLNVGQALRDWGRMRITPEAELQRIFAQRDARADDTQ